MDEAQAWISLEENGDFLTASVQKHRGWIEQAGT